MFSKTFELTGLGLVAWGLASYLSAPAGLIFGGFALVFVGSTTDDDAVGKSIRRGFAWIRYAWHRQLASENGVGLPSWNRPRLREGWVPCSCEGVDDECPLCEGLGYVPDPNYRESARSPHPKVQVDPVSQRLWDGIAKSRTERSKVRDRTPALTRQPPNGDVERIT